MAPPENFEDLMDEMEKQLNEEEIASSKVRDCESEIGKFLKTRAAEYWTPEHLVSKFNPIRNMKATKALLEQVKIFLIDFLCIMKNNHIKM